MDQRDPEGRGGSPDGDDRHTSPAYQGVPGFSEATGVSEGEDLREEDDVAGIDQYKEKGPSGPDGVRHPPPSIYRITR